MRLSQPDRDVVISRDGCACVACAQPFEEIHHRFRRGMGGSSDPEINSPANLICLCRLHHRQAESLRIEASEANGYCVASLPAAFLTPVRTWRGWQLLTAGGTVIGLGPTSAWSTVAGAQTFAFHVGILPLVTP